MHPRLKDVFWRRHGAELRLVCGDRELLRLDDRHGTIELVLDLLRTGSRTVAELAFTAGVPLIAVEQLIDVLDRHRLLIDDDQMGRFCAFDRYGEARSFLFPHATLDVPAHEMLDRLHAAHILLLGAGDINLEVAAQLASLGVGTLTVADPLAYATIPSAHRPRVGLANPEMSNVRRIATRASMIEPTIRAIDVQQPVADAAALGELLDSDRPDVLVTDLGQAATATAWLNVCCVARVVPFASASFGPTGGLVYSVDPGQSACVACVTSGSVATQDADAVRLVYERPYATRCIPPVSALLGSLLVLEVLRYVTGYEPPAYAGQPMRIDVTAGGAMHRLTWRRNQSCIVCRDAARRGFESDPLQRILP
jgi:molybdopterin-synthase adenylyltransferase